MTFEEWMGPARSLHRVGATVVLMGAALTAGRILASFLKAIGFVDWLAGKLVDLLDDDRGRT